MSDKTARLVINAYPVLVLSNEWLEGLFCPKCGANRWCHITRIDRVEHTVRWAARQPTLMRGDGQRWFDPN